MRFFRNQASLFRSDLAEFLAEYTDVVCEVEDMQNGFRVIFDPDGSEEIGFEICVVGIGVTLLFSDDSQEFRLSKFGRCGFESVIEVAIERYKEENQLAWGPPKFNEAEKCSVVCRNPLTWQILTTRGSPWIGWGKTYTEFSSSNEAFNFVQKQECSYPTYLFQVFDCFGNELT